MKDKSCLAANHCRQRVDQFSPIEVMKSCPVFAVQFADINWHLAASKGFEDTTLFLIQQGVGINISDNFGNTPLLEAIKNGHDAVASILVKEGASLSIDDAGSLLCTTIARRDFEFLKRVLAYGINPNAKNYDLRTPLHIATSEGLYSVTNLLLEAGASVLSKDRWGKTPLDEARIGGNKDLIKLLEGARIAQLSEF